MIEGSKFYYVVSDLPPHMVDEVQDVLFSKETTLCKRMSAAVISCTGMSYKQCISSLLVDTELEDR